jgi:hypothetical protein
MQEAKKTLPVIEAQLRMCYALPPRNRERSVPCQMTAGRPWRRFAVLLCRPLLVAGLVLLIGSAPTRAASANEVLPACKLYISITDRQGAANGSEIALLMNAGECLGVIYALLDVSQALTERLKFCPPIQFDAPQGVRTVIKYIEAKPARARDDFTVIALEALRAMWPCR